jgi:hypothetical protein
MKGQSLPSYMRDTHGSYSEKLREEVKDKEWSWWGDG